MGKEKTIGPETAPDRVRASDETLPTRRTHDRPKLRIVRRENTHEVLVDHLDEVEGAKLLMESIGASDANFTAELMTQLANTMKTGGENAESKLNFMLSAIQSIEPRDEVEAMLASQMAATHMAVMALAGRLSRVETIEQQDSAEKAFNKLTRTFTGQVEALKRYRTGGEQKVTVEHVTVNEGGKAIVGSVTGRGV